jgi:hypothetical protein
MSSSSTEYVAGGRPDGRRPAVASIRPFDSIAIPTTLLFAQAPGMWRAQRAVNAPVKPVAVRLCLCAPGGPGILEVPCAARALIAVRFRWSAPSSFARIAQSVERRVEGARVGGSNPSPGTSSNRCVAAPKILLGGGIGRPSRLLIARRRALQVRSLPEQPNFFP